MKTVDDTIEEAGLDFDIHNDFVYNYMHPHNAIIRFRKYCD